MTPSNHNDDDQEMSMDEILASIRRYVSPEEPTLKDEFSKKEESKPVDSLLNRPQLNVTEESYNQRITPRLAMSSHQEEVMRLNEEVNVESKREEKQDPSMWTEKPAFKSSFETKQELPVTRPVSTSLNQSVTSNQPITSAPVNDVDLVSDKTLATTMESFARLRDASTVKTQKYEPAPMSGANPTLDQLFESLARPMIREWLDRNLPSMVERMVTREIERITKG